MADGVTASDTEVIRRQETAQAPDDLIAVAEGKGAARESTKGSSDIIVPARLFLGPRQGFSFDLSQ